MCCVWCYCKCNCHNRDRKLKHLRSKIILEVVGAQGISEKYAKMHDLEGLGCDRHDKGMEVVDLRGGLRTWHGRGTGRNVVLKPNY